MDIVERLRQLACDSVGNYGMPIAGEAADEIERLRAEAKDYFDNWQNVGEERDRLTHECKSLRELLRDARTVMAFEHVLKPDYGWNEMADRIDAALGKEER